jgi:D-alanyl-D-alanine carboxypeptidase
VKGAITSALWWVICVVWTPAWAAEVCTSAPVYKGGSIHVALMASDFPSPIPASRLPLPAQLASQLEVRLESLLRKTGAPALAVAVEVEGLGYWSRTQGLAHVEPPAAAFDESLFYWGSVSKSVTAVLVLQLVQEGKLRLDDSLQQWFPQIPNAEHITIVQLLTHTSGLAVHPQGDPLTAAPDMATRLQQAVDAPSAFCPGVDAAYSNIAYLLLGRLLELLEQEPYHLIVQRRIAGPLGLLHLRALRPDETITPGLATPHQVRTPQPDPAAWQRLGNGNLVATAPDMLRYWKALLTGKLLPPKVVQQQWAQLYPLRNIPHTAQAQQWFGQGVMLTEFNNPAGQRQAWLNHQGGTPTANAVVLYAPRQKAWAAVAVNSAVSAPAVANAMLQVLADWR